MVRKLNEQQERFCENVFKGCAPKEAAIKAGYLESTAEKAWKWKKILKFKKYIEYLEVHGGYPPEYYIRDIEECMALARQGKTAISNSLLRAVILKGKAFGYDKTIYSQALEEVKTQEQIKPEPEKKKPLFERIEEYKKTMPEKDAIYRATIEENPFITLTPTKKQKEFLLSAKREILYGGAAGGGKSAAMLMAALMYVEVPNYKALLLRRTYSQLNLPCALMDMAHQWLDGTEAKWCAQQKQWEFPSGATLNFGYLDTDRDKYRYQGAAFHFIGFDELTQFTEKQYIYLFSRSRKSMTTETPLRFRAASNPGGVGHEWVKRRFFDEKAAERRFISAKAGDNPYLDKKEYEKNLNELDPVTRKQLRDGDWEIMPSGNFFSRERFGFADDFPAKARTVRYWDMAASEKMEADFTVGVRMCALDGQYWVVDVIRQKLSPAGVEKLVRQTAELDGLAVEIFMEQEPGSSGLNNISHYARNILAGFAFKGVKSDKNKAARAKPFAAAVENNNVRLLRGSWNRAFIDECVIFPQDGYHDDQVDAAAGAFGMLNQCGAPADISTVKVDRSSRVTEGY